MINVLNKIDRFADPDAACEALCHLHDSVAVSALTGLGLDTLLDHIEEVLESEMVRVDVVIPFDRGELVGMFHERGLIDKEEYRESGTRIVGRLPETLALQFDAFRTPRPTKQPVPATD
jgi:GTP-binding protein HflX